MFWLNTIHTWHSYNPESPLLALTIESTQSEAPNLGENTFELSQTYSNHYFRKVTLVKVPPPRWHVGLQIILISIFVKVVAIFLVKFLAEYLVHSQIWSLFILSYSKWQLQKEHYSHLLWKTLSIIVVIIGSYHGKPDENVRWPTERTVTSRARIQDTVKCFSRCRTLYSISSVHFSSFFRTMMRMKKGV